MTSAPRHTNRLACESSPYLLQHAHNPVDWYPWGEEAFARARAEDKPILLSVGYATCHWCHVMERESFEDEAIARLLAESFIAIKVDREELPDVDHVYMSALQALTGSGGWPMNLFLTPALAPFYGGTYFPPQARHGLPGFADVLLAVREAWKSRRTDMEQQSSRLLAHVRAGLPAAQGRPARRLHDDAVAQLAQRFDAAYGGFGPAPKFPQAPLLQYLLSLAALGHEQAHRMLTRTLLQMAAGGLYDHVGGGFARYSTDAHWHVPHFEKMLYDNAQLARVYVGACRLASAVAAGPRDADDTAGEVRGVPANPTLDDAARLRFIAEDTLAWLRQEMHPVDAPAAFSCAQDADAEGVEGKFHVWTAGEFRAVLGEDAAAAARLYGVTEDGNWAHGDQPGVSVLQRRDPGAVRTSLGLSPAAWVRWERSVRDRLYAARAQRIRPLTDDKVLADGNGMALRAFAEAGRLLGREELVATARKLAQFLLQTMQVDGRLRHCWRAGVLRSETYLADYAQVGLGLVELHAATGEIAWLQSAHELCRRMVELFHVGGEGFYDSEPGPLPLRARDLFDGAVPSGTAAACELLLRLSGVFEDGTWSDIAWQEIERCSGLLELPAAAPALLHAHLYAEHGSELALPTADGALGALAAARADFAPLVTLVMGPPDAVPLLAGRVPGRAYLCQHGRCQLPAETLAALRDQLARAHTR